MHISLPPFIQH